MKSANNLVPSILCVFLILFTARAAVGAEKITFKVLSYGPISAIVSTPLKLGPMYRFLAETAVIALFKAGEFIASHSDGERTDARVTIDPESAMSAGVLRVRFYDLFHDGVIPLAGGGHLELASDGKLIFRGVDFAGYAQIHYDEKFVVRDNNDDVVLVFARVNGKALVLQEESERAEAIFGLLLNARSRKGVSK